MSPGAAAPSRERVGRLLVACGLVLLVFAVYRQVGNHAFITYDDNLYVTENLVVQRGLTWDGAAWAFGTVHASNWHPLTWLSHMADVEMFGVVPGAHHLVNAFFHAANALILFLALLRMTGGLWRSAFVAALFAVHPLHVESVAWVAERKDLLCAFFWFLTMWAYGGYAARGGAWRYAQTAAFFALALLSKPMAVTLPFALLLLDAWPLGRWVLPGEGPGGAVAPRGIPVSRLVLEKAPLFALSAMSCAVTYLAQKWGGAVPIQGIYPYTERLSNAALSVVGYLGKTAWPASLALYYPHAGGMPGGIPVLGAVVAGLAVAGATVLALLLARRRPYLFTGWFWYLGTLVPVIGLVQIGEQSMADRYTYIPLVGVFAVLAWGACDLFGGTRRGRLALGAAGVAAVLALTVAAHRQASFWRTGADIYRHSVDVVPGNWLMHNNLGDVLLREGRDEEAIAHFRESLRIAPWVAAVRCNLGFVLARRGRTDEAIAEYREALRQDPTLVTAHINLGEALLRKGDAAGAFMHFREAVRLDPGNPIASGNLERLLKAMRVHGDKGPAAPRARPASPAFRGNPWDGLKGGAGDGSGAR